MSSYYRKTKHPVTGEWERASWIDNYFDAHHYGVKFYDGTIVDPEKVALETANEDSNPVPIKFKIPESLEFDYRNYRKDMVCPLCKRQVWVGVDQDGKESICQKCLQEAYA